MNFIYALLIALLSLNLSPPTAHAVGGPPAILAVSPQEAFVASGSQGGPFTPASKEFILSNSGGATLNFTVTTTQNWLSASPASGSIAVGDSATVTVSLNSNADALAAGSYSDSISFNSSGNGSQSRTANLTVGTGANPGVLSVSPQESLQASGSEGGPFSPSSKEFTLTNTGGSTLTFSASAAVNWITVSPASGTLDPTASTTVTVSINSNAEGLSADSYTEEVSFANDSNSNQDPIPRTVALTVGSTPNPGVLSVSPQENFQASGYVGGPFTPGSKDFALTNTGGSALNFTVTPSADWISVSAASGSLGAGESTTVTVSLNESANALAADTYSKTVSFTNTSNSNQDAIPRTVTLIVGSTPNPGILNVSPQESLQATGDVGGPFTPGSKDFTLSNTGGSALNFTVSANADWISLSATSGSLGAGESTTVTVSLNENANALAADTYSKTVSFTNASNSNQDAIPRSVTLTVGSSPNPGILSVSPQENLQASGYVGGPFSPDTKEFTISNTGGSALNFTVTPSADWISVSAAGGSLGAGESTTVTVSINESANALAADSYSKMVSFANTSNSNQDAIPRTVTLIVGSTPNPGILSVSPQDSLVATGTAGGPFTPGAKEFTLSNTGGSALNFTVTPSADWIEVSATAGSLDAGASTTVTTSINDLANALAAGSYSKTVSFANTSNSNQDAIPRTVSLTVGSTPNPGVLSVSPQESLVATGSAGGPFTPGAQEFTLTNTGGTALDFTVGADADWISLSATAGSLEAGASTTVTVSINESANTLLAGSYSDSIAFTNTTSGNGSASRQASLTITESQGGVLAVSPQESYQATGPAGGPFTPAFKSFTLTNTGGEALEYTITNNEAWTTLSNSGGTLAAGESTTVIVSLNSAAESLATGAYADALTITNTTNGNGSTSRTVALRVSSATEGILSVTPQESYIITGNTGGPFAPAAKTFTITNTGGAPLDYTVSATQSWLSLSQSSGTLAAGASATIIAAVNATADTLAASNYYDSITFSNITTGDGDASRPVTLIVNPTPPAVLFVTPTENYLASGPPAGPFAPATKEFIVTNAGSESLTYAVSTTQAWITLSASGGILAPDASATITATINAEADSLTAGTYYDAISFSNISTGYGNTSRSIILVINDTAPGVLTVTPASDATICGPEGGPFTPQSVDYTVTNAGGTELSYGVTVGQSWLTLSPNSGTLAPGASETVTITVNEAATALGTGSYFDALTFSDLTSGNNTVSRSIGLSVEAIPKKKIIHLYMPAIVRGARK